MGQIDGFKITETSDVIDKIFKHRDNYHVKGKYLGFEVMDKHYSMSLGNCTDWTGFPMSGKTQVLMECLMNTSKFYGWKHLVYFPDVGNNVEILADLLHKKTGKSFDPKAHNTITDAEITREMDWVLNHFKILTRKDTKGKITPVDFWKMAVELKYEEGLHTASIDSWKDLNHEYEKYGGYAQYLEYVLPLRNYLAEENNLHFHTIIHPKLTEKENGKRNAPTPHDLKGGSEWFNSGKCMITVHRENPSTNEVQIYFNKIKPRSIGEVGEILLRFDKSKFVYYVDEWQGNQSFNKYAQEKHESNSFPAKQSVLKPDIVNGKELLSFSERMKQGAFEELKPIENNNGEMTMPF
jgi:hypothetical protein